MSTALTTLTAKLAKRLDMGDGAGLAETLKATAFKGQVSDAQMTALMVVANQFGLNPWTKEIYAFPDKNNGIVPVVGVDGWARIINDHPAFDGMDFVQDADSCTCVMYRKDRGHPIKVTEYMVECVRPGVGPWASHPWRMLRHKAMIQCARIAFGFGGIYDPDEAERIVATTIDGATGEIIQKTEQRAAATLPSYTDEEFAGFLKGVWQTVVNKGTKPEGILSKVSTKYSLTEAQVAAIKALKPVKAEDVTDAEVKPATPYSIEEKLRAAKNIDELNIAADLINSITDTDANAALSYLYDQRLKEFQ